MNITSDLCSMQLESANTLCSMNCCRVEEEYGGGRGEGGLCDNSKEGENWEFYHLKFYIKIQKSTGRKLGNNLSFKFNLKVEYCVRVRGELKLNDSKEYKS